MNKVIRIEENKLIITEYIDKLRDILYSKRLIVGSFYRTFSTELAERGRVGSRIEALLDIIEESSGFTIVCVRSTENVGEAVYYFQKDI